MQPPQHWPSSEPQYFAPQENFQPQDIAVVGNVRYYFDRARHDMAVANQAAVASGPVPLKSPILKSPAQAKFSPAKPTDTKHGASSAVREFDFPADYPYQSGDLSTQSE